MAQLGRKGLTVVDDGMDRLLCAPLGRVNDGEGRRSLSRVRELKVVGNRRRADFVRAPLGRCRRRREEALLLLACGRRGGAATEHREGHDGDALLQGSERVDQNPLSYEVTVWTLLSLPTLRCAGQRERSEKQLISNAGRSELPRR